MAKTTKGRNANDYEHKKNTLGASRLSKMLVKIAAEAEGIPEYQWVINAVEAAALEQGIDVEGLKSALQRADQGESVFLITSDLITLTPRRGDAIEKSA